MLYCSLEWGILVFPSIDPHVYHLLTFQTTQAMPLSRFTSLPEAASKSSCIFRKTVKWNLTVLHLFFLSSLVLKNKITLQLTNSNRLRTNRFLLLVFLCQTFSCFPILIPSSRLSWKRCWSHISYSSGAIVWFIAPSHCVNKPASSSYSWSLLSRQKTKSILTCWLTTGQGNKTTPPRPEISYYNTVFETLIGGALIQYSFCHVSLWIFSLS